MKSAHEDMRSIIDEWMTDIKDARKETTACNEAKKTEQDPEMMQSAEEHQEIHTEDATIMPVGEPRKQRRVRKLAAERRQKI
jgi:hypothetical protein